MKICICFDRWHIFSIIMEISQFKSNPKFAPNTVELQWLEHPRDYENMFETGIVRANEC